MKQSSPRFSAKRFSAPGIATLAALIALWQLLSMSGVIPGYMLPSPTKVIAALKLDFLLLMNHLRYTLLEAMAGLALAAAAAFVLAIVMDANRLIRQSLAPLLLLTQTIPTIIIAPLLILWMGYGSAPKITLVFIFCFFPMTIALLGAFARSDADAIKLLQSMGASRLQIYQYIKLPQALPAFFSGLKIAGSYSIIGAVVSEWLGGNAGLGVYMIRVRRSYSFDKMFAVILLTSVLSIVLIKLIEIIEKRALPWNKSINN
jgi:ABC-type nitrate/sulfonate/bicarbonate transport system permease component